MDKDKLLAFLSVAEANSFSKGADNLFVNQPTVSARVRALECELDVKLFEREKGKGIKLSLYGEIFLPYAKEILDMMHTSKELLAREKELNDFHIRIGTSVYGNYLLPIFFSEFHRANPNLEISIVSGYTPDIVAMVESGALDIGFVNDIIDFNNVEDIKLLAEELILVFSPEYFKEYKNPLPFQEITDKTLIIFGKKSEFEKNNSNHPILYEYCKEYNWQLDKIIFIDQIEPLKGLIKQGNGLALLPRMMVETELKRGEYVSVSVSPPMRSMGIHLIYCKERERPVVKSIKKIVAEHFGKKK